MAESQPPKSRDSADPLFTAKDIKEAAGLSYRQLNDWDAKGVLPGSRDKDGRWRKYTPRDLFVIMVLAEIRKRFGVPLESLSWVKSFMLQEGANHFAAAVDLIGGLGVSVFVVTDLSKAFMMVPDIEFGDLMTMGWYRGNDPDQFLAIKVNPLVNRLLGCLKEPIHLEAHGWGYDLVAQPSSAAKRKKRVRGRTRNTKKST